MVRYYVFLQNSVNTCLFGDEQVAMELNLLTVCSKQLFRYKNNKEAVSYIS